MKKQATIYDVAKSAGVSLATVSRVINGSDRVRAKTRNRVQEVIDKLNYRPSAVARGLATSKSTNLAVVLPNDNLPHVSDLITGICDVARIYGYNILFYTATDLGNNENCEATVERLVKARVDGVIVFNDYNIKNNREVFDVGNIPIVFIGGKPEKDDNPLNGYVYANFEDVYYNLVKSYIDAGKSDIFFVTSHQNIFDQESLLNGIKKAFATHNIKFENVIDGYVEYHDNVRLFDEFFSVFNPDAIICAYDLQAAAVVESASKAGIEIPKQMEVWGLGNAEYAEMINPKLSSIYIPMYDMGAIALRLLTKMLEEENEERVVEIKSSIIIRETGKNE